MKKALVVEDSEAIQKLVKSALSTIGINDIETAMNGLEAVEKYKNSKPDFVVMDLLMPEMSGLDAIKQIRKEDSSANIIVLTAVDKDGLEKECIEAGAKEYIRKPFSVDKLLSAVESIG